MKFHMVCRSNWYGPYVHKRDIIVVYLPDITCVVFFGNFFKKIAMMMHRTRNMISTRTPPATPPTRARFNPPSV